MGWVWNDSGLQVGWSLESIFIVGILNKAPAWNHASTAFYFEEVQFCMEKYEELLLISGQKCL